MNIRFVYSLCDKICIFYFIAATRRNNNSAGATDAEIIPTVQRWFRNARDLKGGRKRNKDVILLEETENRQQ